MKKIALLILCTVLFFLTACNAKPTMSSSDAQVPTSDIVIPTLMVTGTRAPSATVTATTLPTVTPIVVTSIPKPTAIPTATPRVMEYKLNGTIDLASGSLVAMAIYKADGSVITSSWASAIAYKGDDKPEVFDPKKGTIYSHNDGGFTATWIHSGRSSGVNMFGYGLEKAVWLNPQGQILKLDQGMKKTAELIGTRVVLCQAIASEKIKLFAEFDHKAACPGSKLEFTVTAAALIKREKSDEYEAAVGKVVPWLIVNFPEAGFGKLKTGEGYLIQTCVGRYADQKSDGTVDYLYNRLVIGLSLK